MDRTMSHAGHGLHAGFLRSCVHHPDRPALEVEGVSLTYAQLQGRASCIAGAIASALPQGAPRLVGLLGSRSLTVYAGLLGILMSGCAIVPLNPAFPAQRTCQMLAHADVRALVIDAAGTQLVDELLAGASQPMLLLLAQTDDVADLAARWPQHRFLDADQVAAGSLAALPQVAPDDWAYLFYTSGSTGTPKGVGVQHRNAVRFVEMSLERYTDLGIGEQDRFSQFYDITFDSSMFDLYVSWAFGACLCVPSLSDWINPNKFIESRALTVIDIVPSTGRNMNRADGWRPGRFTGLRLCRFGGEALSADLAAKLAAAAPMAAIDNVYGPTECTVDAAYYRWQAGRSELECEHGVVPIGSAGPRVQLRVADAELNEVAAGQEGELLIAGPQVTPGYWQDDARTAAAFVTVADGTRFYRTGDLVRRPLGTGPITFLGRLDHQIKISGVRIELGEIELAVRDASGAEHAVALGWPLTLSGASGIVVFVSRQGMGDIEALRAGLKARLPQVMVPREIHVVDDFPLNVNGKVDRKALLARLQASTAAA
jgi:amino acid adenylation domain-containing protein